MAVAPGSLLGRYHILSPLGAGGMGEVYLAKDTQLDREVAIKFPIAKSDEHHTHARFLREARSVSALSHRNIAIVFDYGESEDGLPYLVMELIKGESLTDLMYSSALTLSRSVEIISDVAEALAEAHKHGVIHRDIKPSNVMINERGEVKVLDFGLAKQLREEVVGVVDKDAQTLLATQTQSGVVVGTPLYLSPEQATSAPVDARSDIFALGSLLYECITGRSAFHGKGVIEITAQIIHVDPPLPSTINPRIPPELDRITIKALEKKPEARYQSAEEMMTDLRSVRALIDDDAVHHTLRMTPADKTNQSSAVRTLSDLLQRPRISIGRLLLAVTAIGLITFLLWFTLLRSKIYEPTVEAKRWYDKGTAAMRDGAYDQASKSFLEAIKMDDKYALAHARLAEAWTELDYDDKAKDEMLRVNSIVRDRSALPQLEALYVDAITAIASRNFSLAITSYAEIARLVPDQAYVYLDLGRAYEKNDDVTKAIENYLEATKRDSQYAPAFLRVGILYGRKGEQASAGPAFDKAELLYRASSNFEGVAEVLYQRGVLLNKIGKADEARQNLQKALETAQTTTNLHQQIRSLFQLGIISRAQGDTVTAKRLATEAIDLARANRQENLTTQGLIDLGNVYFARDEFDEAEKYFQQAIDFAQRSGGRRNEARALLSLGSVFIQKDNPDQGLPYIKQALPFFQQGGYRRETSQALALIARAQEMKGNYEAAFQALSTQLKLAEESGDQPQIALLHSGIGTVLMRQERYPEALTHFETSYNITSSTDKKLDSGFHLMNRGDVLWRLGRYAEARTFLDKALSIADRPNESNQQLLCRIWQTSAFMALSEQKFAESIAFCKRALQINQNQNANITIEAKSTLGLAQAYSGNKVEAKKSCEEALELAVHEPDPNLKASALLALAEVMLLKGETQGALDNATKALERFEGIGQTDAAWQARLIAGTANQTLGKSDAANADWSRSRSHLASLQQKWGDDYFQSYLRRPDVQHHRQKLNKASVALK